MLAREGAADNHLYEVVDGTLGVVKQLGTPAESLLATLHPGEFAHELGFLDGAERYASLVASSDARVLVLEREKLESLIDTHPRIVYRRDGRDRPHRAPGADPAGDAVAKS